MEHGGITLRRDELRFNHCVWMHFADGIEEKFDLSHRVDKDIHWVCPMHAQHTDTITISEGLRPSVTTARLQVAQISLDSVTISLNIKANPQR